MRAKADSIRWPAVRRQLADWPRPALLALVKDLNDISRENRDFLRARLDAENAGGPAWESFRERITEQFFGRRGPGKLKLPVARKAIRDYRKATGNLPGTIDLLLTYLENGTEFALEFGDNDAAFYNSMVSVAEEIQRLLLQEGGATYQLFLERILRVALLADGIGWGYGDYLRDWVEALENELGGA